MKILGKYNGLEVVDVEGTAVALDGWNGEIYTKCFEVSDRTEGGLYLEDGDYTRPVRPTYEQDGDDWEIVDYEFCF